MSTVDDSEVRDGEPAADDGDDRGTLGRWIAVSLAAIAVVGAAIAILQTDASVNESNTARETTRTAVAALRAGVTEKGGSLLEDDIEAESGALRRQLDFVANQAGDAAPVLSSSELRSILPENGNLPGVRTREALRRLSVASELLSLTQAALAETRVTWNDRSTQYTTAIAVLAFALFLVGFSLVLSGTQRLVFYLFGIAVAVFTVGAVIYVYSLPIPETSSEAISATARGRVASDQGDQQRAIRLFSEAIEIDDEFAAPYSYRAIARAFAANPDLQATGAVTGGVGSLDQAIADVRRALDLEDDRDTLALAFAAIAGLYAGQYEKSIQAADEAIAINSEVPDIRLVKSAAEVGLGDAGAAIESLDAARDLIKGSDPSERTRGLVASYLTYLEEVVHQVPERRDLAGRIEQRIIGTETEFSLGRKLSRRAPDRGSVEVTGLRYGDGQISLRTAWSDLPAGTAVTLIGFERPARGSGWVQPRELALFRTLGGSGEQTGRVPISRNCTPVELRVDVYLDGAFSDRFTGPGGPATC